MHARLAPFRIARRFIPAFLACASTLSAQTPRPVEVAVTYVFTDDTVSNNGAEVPRIDVEVSALFDQPYLVTGVGHWIEPLNPGNRRVYLAPRIDGPNGWARLAPGGNREFAGQLLAINSDEYRPAGWGPYALRWSTGLPAPANGLITPEYQAAQYAPGRSVMIPIPEFTTPPELRPGFAGSDPLPAQTRARVGISPLANAPEGSFVTVELDRIRREVLPATADSVDLGVLQPRGKRTVTLTQHWRLSQTVVEGVVVNYYAARRVTRTFTAAPTGVGLTAYGFNVWSSRVDRGVALEFPVFAGVESATELDDAGNPLLVAPDAAIYRLYRDDTLIQSVSNGILTLDTTNAPSLARYRLEVSARGETTTAGEFVLEVASPTPGAAVTFVRSPTLDPLRAIRAGAALALMAEAVGPNGERFDPATFAGVAAVNYRWFLNGQATTYTGPSLILTSVGPAEEGDWTVQASAGGRSAMSSTFTVRGGEFATIPAVRLVNVSARVNTGSGLDQVVVGAATTGPSRLLVRHVGPSLQTFGLSATLSNPTIALYSGQTLVAENDDWGVSAAELAPLFEEVGAFSLSPDRKDSAMVQNVDAGLITASLGFGGTADGTSLAEFYVVEGDPVRNLSVRGKLARDFGDATLGFVLAGSGTKTYVIRVMGSGLGQFGLNSALNPRIRLNAGDTALASNLDWEQSEHAIQLQAAIARSGGVPLQTGLGETALLATLGAGSYTVTIQAESDTEGLYLAEIWEVPGAESE